MTALCFVDTNIWIYAMDDRYPAKRDAARAFLRERARDVVVSPQVCAEFHRVAVSKLGLSSSEVRSGVDRIAGFRSVVTDIDLLLEAVTLVDRSHLSIWDAMIVRAAVRGGCGQLASEDLTHGASIDGVEILNPFASS